MTVVVGIRCTDGVVIGTDSAMILGPSAQQLTIEQPYRSKIDVIDSHIIVAGTGQIGLGQRFAHEVEQLWKEKSFAGKSLVEIGALIAKNTLGNFISTHVPSGQYGALVAVPCGKRAELIEFDAATFQPEFKTVDNWYASMGSGQMVADPLLGFVRQVFWGDSPPKRQDGVFAATMVLKLACDMAPLGVAPPIQMAIFAPNHKGQLAASHLSEDELHEHEGNVKEALEYFSKYPDQIRNPPDGPMPPAPPAPHVGAE